MANVLYTVGYEGRSQHELIDCLLSHGIRCLIDVRRNAISRKRGFSKKALEEWCSQHGLRYVHIPQVGIPSDVRRDYLADGRYDELLAVYAKEIMREAPQEVDQVIEMVSETSCVLMCFEADAERCHRSPLARCISRKAQVTVRHLG